MALHAARRTEADVGEGEVAEGVMTGGQIVEGVAQATEAVILLAANLPGNIRTAALATPIRTDSNSSTASHLKARSPQERMSIRISDHRRARMGFQQIQRLPAYRPLAHHLLALPNERMQDINASLTLSDRRKKSVRTQVRRQRHQSLPSEPHSWLSSLFMLYHESLSQNRPPLQTRSG